MTDNRPMISPEEMQRRRAHVKAAIADSRIEGYPHQAARSKTFSMHTFAARSKRATS
jgi:hypothetical protein